jgi:hypothetical protein
MENIVTPDKLRVRLALVAPFAAAAVTALILLAVSFAAAGTADEFGYPSWAPTAGGALFALPTLIASMFFARAIWLKVGRPFRIRWARLVFGLAAVAAAIAFTASYVALVGDASSYRGEFNDLTQKYGPMYSLKAFLWVSAMIAVTFPMGGIWFLAKIAYLDAIESAGLAHVEGLDPIGELIKDRLGR